MQKPRLAGGGASVARGRVRGRAQAGLWLSRLLRARGPRGTTGRAEAGVREAAELERLLRPGRLCVGVSGFMAACGCACVRGSVWAGVYVSVHRYIRARVRAPASL